MGRKSKLSPEQWADVDRRLLEGEAARAIARDLSVAEAIIRARKKTRVEKIKDAANQVVAANRAVKGLDLPAQHLAMTFSQKLQAMSESLAEAGMLGAQNAAHLKRLAQGELVKVTAANLDPQALAKAKELGSMASDEADVALRIVGAQKDQVKRANETPPADAPDLSNLTAEELKALEATMHKVQTRPAAVTE